MNIIFYQKKKKFLWIFFYNYVKKEDWNVLAPQCFDGKRKDKSMRNTSNKRRRISFFTCNHTLISYFITTLYSSFLLLSSIFSGKSYQLDKICQKPHVILHTLNVPNWYWPSIISTNCKLPIQHICFIHVLEICFAHHV